MHSSMHIYIYEALFLYISKVYTIVFAPLPPQCKKIDCVGEQREQHLYNMEQVPLCVPAGAVSGQLMCNWASH